MATIVYGVAGEGRGHATRVRAVVEALRREHRFIVFAPDDAHDMLAPLYAGSEVRVERIPGLRFAYDAAGTLSPWRTASATASYLAALPSLVARVQRTIEDEAAALVITDFEPSTPRAALRAGVPFVSFDHQHFLSVGDFSSMPKRLQVRAAAMGAIVDLFCTGQESTIVSSFCFPPLRAGVRRVLQVGSMLRPRIVEAVPEHGTHLIAYVRKFASPAFLDALAGCGRPVRCYGLGEREAIGDLTFHRIDERRFVEDLATAYALVTTAGNQLLGEAQFLGKPVFAIPEAGNAEQTLHGHLLAREGTGEWCDDRHVDAAAIRAFLERADDYRSRIVRERLHGNPAALAEVRRVLGGGRPALVALRERAS